MTDQTKVTAAPRPAARVEIANASDLNVVVSALQGYWAQLWRAHRALLPKSPSNAAMMARKANHVAGLLDKMRVGWKKPDQLPIEFLRANEAARFWVKAEDIGKILAGMVFEADMVTVYDPETGEVHEPTPDVYRWCTVQELLGR